MPLLNRSDVVSRQSQTAEEITPRATACPKVNVLSDVRIRNEPNGTPRWSGGPMMLWPLLRWSAGMYAGSPTTFLSVPGGAGVTVLTQYPCPTCSAGSSVEVEPIKAKPLQDSGPGSPNTEKKSDNPTGSGDPANRTSKGMDTRW